MPKSFTFVSNAKPSLFRYPDFLQKDEKKQGEKVETAVLSTTVKVKARAERKNKGDGSGGGEGEKPMQIDNEQSQNSVA